MHRRNSTRSGAIDRRKSTSSVKSVQLEHILPDTAERDAQAAAAQAFARAKDRSAVDAPLWPPSRNYVSSRATGFIGTPDRRTDDTPLRRQQSVRFVRPAPTQLSRSYTRGEDLTPTRKPNTVRLQVTTRGVEPCPASTATTAGMTCAAKGAAGDYISALITGEEYYTPEDDIASAPSSYRRIRKSKSMFSGSQTTMLPPNHMGYRTSATMNQLPSPSPGYAGPRTDENKPPVGLKAPKSMSFLRSRREQPMPHPDHQGEMPHASSTNEFSGTYNPKGKLLKAQPSTFFRSKRASTDRTFRKSMRDVSNHAMSTTGQPSKEGSLRHKARKVSLNLKHKLKNLFSSTKGENDESMLPPQQIEARKSHVTGSDSLEEDFNDEFRPTPTAEEGALSRVTSGVASLHAVPSYQQLRSRQGSLESLRSERKSSDERSRVTSWTNSDTATLNTMSSQRSAQERQRLSIIKENGTHISSSATRSGATHSHPMNRIPQLQPAIPVRPVTVDSHRIYSALMKRMNETQKNKHIRAVHRQRSVDSFVDSGVVPPRGSSNNCETRGSGTPVTIRYVRSDSESDSGSSRTVERKPVIIEPRSGIEDGASSSTPEGGPSQWRTGFQSSALVHQSSGLGGSSNGDGRFLSVPGNQEPQAFKATLSSRSSAFFGSPTCHLFRTQSPYRRALQDTIRTTSEEEQPGSPEFNPWMRSISDLPMRCPSTCESEVDKKMHYAESIYSSTTEDQTNGIDNGLSAPKYSPPRPPSVHGDATIFVDPPVYRSQPVPFKRRMTSTASSVEWKSWLSANVSKLKESPVVPETSRLDYTLPVALFSGHVREKAQMNDEEEDQHPPEVYEPSRPGTVHASTVPDAETLSPVIQEALRDDSQAPGSKKQNEASEPPPPPPKSILRTAPSVASMGSARTVSKPLTENTNKEKVGAMDQKFLAHMSSLNALSGNQSRGGTPGTVKLVKRQPRPKGSNTSLSSPGLANAVERQFGKLEGSIRSKQNNTHAHPNSENVSPHVGGDDDPYGINGAVVLGPDETEDGQGVGSKRMVDFFLSSRRKRMASSDEGEVFL